MFLYLFKCFKVILFFYFQLNEEIGKTTPPILLNGNNEEKPAEVTSVRSVRTVMILIIHP